MKNALPKDTNSPPPRAVRAAAERAEELIRQQTQAPQEDEASQEEQPQEQAFQEEAPQEQPQDETRQEQPQNEPSEDDTWKRKFEAANGRVRQLVEEVDSLRRVLATMEQADQGAPSPKVEKLITPEEEAEYGPEFLGVVEKKAREVNASLQAEIDRLNKKLEKISENTKTSARDRMIEKLETRVPGWQEQNNEPGFLDWLEEIDPYSGQKRLAMLRSSWERNDATRVLAFFEGYRKEAAPKAPQTTEARPAKPQSSLEKFAAPGRAKPTAAQSAPDSKPIFTRAQIAAFYRSKSSDYRGGEQERKQLEKQIFEAVAEGRVR